MVYVSILVLVDAGLRLEEQNPPFGRIFLSTSSYT